MSDQWEVIRVQNHEPQAGSDRDRATSFHVRQPGETTEYQVTIEYATSGEGPSPRSVLTVINGQVDERGNVVVNLRYGQSSANGSGHLTESDGEGRWQGASTSSSCSGRWEAERRS